MNNPVDNRGSRETRLTFVPDRRYTALAAGGILLALVLALFAADAAGRLLALGAALLCAGYAISDLVFSPRLVVSGEGVTVRSPLMRVQLPWEVIERIDADTRSRFGLRATTLEIDAGPWLAVLSRRALGADPAEVAALVQAMRPG